MRVFLISKLMLALFATSLSVLAQDVWDRADAETVRLHPSAFSYLPDRILKYLERRKCMIPQTYMTTDPHNVIKGEFTKLGQTDWAVLCSVNRTSSILVFWNGSTKKISKIATSPDKSDLQGIGDGKIGFSRMIEAVSKQYIEVHYRRYGGINPPPSKHQGINDAFTEKASQVHYFYQRRWMLLQGAD